MLAIYPTIGQFLVIAIILVFAVAIETMIGFGGMLFALSLGAYFIPFDELIYLILPINLLLSIGILIIDFKSVDWRVLFKKIIPLFSLGVILSILTKHLVWGNAPLFFFSIIILVLAILKLASSRSVFIKFEPYLLRTLLFLGGFVHGIFATGGPFVVMATQFIPLTKFQVRSTLAMLWVLVNVYLIFDYAWAEKITLQTLAYSSFFVPSVVLGILVGQKILPMMSKKQCDRLTLVLLVAAALLSLNKSL